MPARYCVPAAALCFEVPKTKGSRFIADVAPAEDAEEAAALVAAVRKREHAARHVCWAWRLGEDGETARSSDDGEPSGSAGKPILAALEGADLTFAVVTVTRYFGGTKLGVGGLVRAYGGAAAAALEQVEVHTVVPTADILAVLDYPDLGVLEAFIAREGVDRPALEYGEGVTATFSVPRGEAAEFAARLVDQSAGRITARVLDP